MPKIPLKLGFSLRIHGDFHFSAFTDDEFHQPKTSPHDSLQQFPSSGGGAGPRASCIERTSLRMARCFSFTGSADFLYRRFFFYSGLRSVRTGFPDGTKMHCWVPKSHKPSKPNLVLVHGFGANAMWQYGDLLPSLTPRFNIYVPDLLFFGESSTSRPERSEEFQAECVMRMMAEHGVQRMSLVGISYGGFVGYSMAAQFPDAVEKVVLCCSGVCLEERDLREGFFEVADLDDVASILMPQTPEKLRQLMKFAFARPVKGVPSYFLSDYIDVFCTDHIAQKKELIKALTRDRQLSRIPRIQQPTLIIWGDQDRIFPLELGHRLQRHIGDTARLVVIKDAGHAVNVEKPREFAKHLKSFLVGPPNLLLKDASKVSAGVALDTITKLKKIFI